MNKKSLTLILSFLLVFTVFSFTAEAAEIIDMPENWSTKALEKAVSAGFLKGDGGRIRAGDSLTRAEMATVINRVFEAEEEASLKGYIDVNPDNWFYSEMAKAVEMGTFKGDGDKLEPNKPISRQEAFVVIARALDLETSSDEPEGLTDLGNLDSWAKEEVYALVNAGYVKGSDGKLNPKGEITRAEFAQLLDNITSEDKTEELEMGKSELIVITDGIEIEEDRMIHITYEELNPAVDFEKIGVRTSDSYFYNIDYEQLISYEDEDLIKREGKARISTHPGVMKGDYVLITLYDGDDNPLAYYTQAFLLVE